MIEYLPANGQPPISITASPHASLTLLAEISRQVTVLTDVNKILDLLCHKVLLASGADRALMVMLENDRPVRFNYQGFKPDFDFSNFEDTWQESVEPNIGFKLAGKTLAWANHRNEAQVKYDPALNELARQMGGAAWLVIPFILDRSNAGLIWLIKEQPYEWPGLEVSQAEDFGVIAGLAIQNAQMQLDLAYEQERRTQLVTLARNAAHDLNQQLSVLQAELDLAMMTGQPSIEELMNRMQLAVEKMTERVRDFQKTVRTEVW
jgi:hypothetical protein